jgi:hypothetical protein
VPGKFGGAMLSAFFNRKKNVPNRKKIRPPLFLIMRKNGAFPGCVATF